MLIRTVRMTFAPAHVERFLALFEAARPKIRQRPGCEHLALWRDARYPNVFTTYSLWRDAEALEAYRRFGPVPGDVGGDEAAVRGGARGAEPVRGRLSLWRGRLQFLAGSQRRDRCLRRRYHILRTSPQKRPSVGLHADSVPLTYWFEQTTRKQRLIDARTSGFPSGYPIACRSRRARRITKLMRTLAFSGSDEDRRSSSCRKVFGGGRRGDRGIRVAVEPAAVDRRGVGRLLRPGLGEYVPRSHARGPRC